MNEKLGKSFIHNLTLTNAFSINEPPSNDIHIVEVHLEKQTLSLSNHYSTTQMFFHEVKFSNLT